MACESVEDCYFEKSTNHFSLVVFSPVSVYHRKLQFTLVSIYHVWLIGSYTDGAIVERLLPSCLQGHVEVSL